MKLWFDVEHGELLIDREVFTMYKKYLDKMFESYGIDTVLDNMSFLDWFGGQGWLCEAVNSEEFLSKPHIGHLHFTTEDRVIMDSSEVIDEYARMLHEADNAIEEVMNLSLQQWLDDNYFHVVTNSEEFLERIKKGEVK